MKKINRLVLYVAAGLLIGEIFCKFNIILAWGFICVPIIVGINVISRNKKSDMVLLVLLFLLSLCVGAFMYGDKLKVLTGYDDIIDGKNVSIIGKVSNIWENVNGRLVELEIPFDDVKVLCYFGEFDYEIGKVVTIEGSKNTIDTSTNPGEFDLKEYYNSKEIFMVLRNCQVVKEGDEYSEILQWFYVARQSLKNAIIDICDEEDAGVLCAMLFGDKEYLDENVKNLYTESGIGHILTISGVCTLSLVSLRPP